MPLMPAKEFVVQTNEKVTDMSFCSNPKNLIGRNQIIEVDGYYAEIKLIFYLFHCPRKNFLYVFLRI